MEAGSEPQHRTKVNLRAGRSVRVSVLRDVTPDSQSGQAGIEGGGGGKSCVLTPGGLFGSALCGRLVSNDGAMPEEKSDHPIVVPKPGNAGGAKGVTG